MSLISLPPLTMQQTSEHDPRRGLLCGSYIPHGLCSIFPTLLRSVLAAIYAVSNSHYNMDPT